MLPHVLAIAVRSRESVNERDRRPLLFGHDYLSELSLFSADVLLILCWSFMRILLHYDQGYGVGLGIVIVLAWTKVEHVCGLGTGTGTVVTAVTKNCSGAETVTNCSGCRWFVTAGTAGAGKLVYMGTQIHISVAYTPMSDARAVAVIVGIKYCSSSTKNFYQLWNFLNPVTIAWATHKRSCHVLLCHWSSMRMMNLLVIHPVLWCRLLS